MKILIIEDEGPIRETLQDLLEMNGHTVLAAADGPEGAKLAEQHPDLIFCDVGLPGMDGYEVITAVRNNPHSSDVPFIFLTARADRDDQRHGMALGADDYITKPFTERDITDAINARVRRQQPLRERVEKLVTERRHELDAQWSHELMTPLNGVLGGLELIESEADTIKPGELKGLLGLIRAGAERQLALSRKLVLYYELEQMKANARPEAFDCNVADAITAAAERAVERDPRSADLDVQFQPGTVRLLENHLTGALAEVIDNAFRFSRPGQPVTVHGRRSGDRYRIEITDQGTGMTAEQRAGVGPFIQFNRERSNQQGLGLGLAIARSTADLAGGSLTLEAAGPGEVGLKVAFDLPCEG